MEMLTLTLKVFLVDQNVFKVDENEEIKEAPQNIINKGLEGGQQTA